jgi:hypothetical protein
MLIRDLIIIPLGLRIRCRILMLKYLRLGLMELSLEMLRAESRHERQAFLKLAHINLLNSVRAEMEFMIKNQ